MPSHSREHGIPDSSEELLEAEADAMATPIGVTSLHGLVLSYTIFRCQFAAVGEPRSVQDFRRMLLVEAALFEKGDGWRGDNPALAKILANDLRHVATEELPRRARGRPRAIGSAMALLDTIIDAVEQNLIERGRPDMAATLLDPGQGPQPGERGGKGSNLSVILGFLLDLNRQHGSPFSEQEIRKAVDHRRRSERRRRKAGKSR